MERTAPGRVTDERGASSVEYALLIGFIAAVIVATLLLLGTDVAGLSEIDFNPED